MIYKTNVTFSHILVLKNSSEVNIDIYNFLRYIIYVIYLSPSFYRL